MLRSFIEFSLTGLCLLSYHTRIPRWKPKIEKRGEWSTDWVLIDGTISIDRSKHFILGEVLPVDEWDPPEPVNVLGIRHFALASTTFRRVSYTTKIPGWIPILFLGIYPLAKLGVSLAKKRREQRKGMCRKCGYDLRLLPEPRCPECGAPFTADDTNHKAV